MLYSSSPVSQAEHFCASCMLFRIFFRGLENPHTDLYVLLSWNSLLSSRLTEPLLNRDHCWEFSESSQICPVKGLFASPSLTSNFHLLHPAAKIASPPVFLIINGPHRTPSKHGPDSYSHHGIPVLFGHVQCIFLSPSPRSSTF